MCLRAITNFSSHHLLIHKLGVVRTLYERSDPIVIDEKDIQEEIKHINKALLNCNYPHGLSNKSERKWTINYLKRRRTSGRRKRGLIRYKPS